MNQNLISKNFISFSILFFIFTLSAIFCHSSMAEVEWQREYGTMVDGKYLVGAYTGGISHSKPTFVDIDDDGDYDMFVGEWFGNIHFYRNDGTPTSPSWTFMTQNYSSIDVGQGSAPTFCDIDNDGDYDMFIGKYNGKINFYRNDGTSTSPSWTFVTEYYNSIYVGYDSNPTFCDIDADGDYDMFIGESDGNIHFYRNDGTATSPFWTFVTEYYNSIDVGDYSTPTFGDIDDDGDYDMFTGDSNGRINFYRNDGTSTSPSWTFVTEYYNSIDVGEYSAPTFCDIDGDGDYDMFIGERYGNINSYRNDGTSTSPSWTFVTKYYNSIDVGYDSTPTFCDIDADGDYDMFIGERDGNINFYRNDGTSTLPSWTFVTEYYNSIDVGYDSTPTFCDIDADGDYDMFIGERDGNINFYRNDGTSTSPSWTFVTKYYNSIDLGDDYAPSAPSFCDIDSDSDYDMFIGDLDGNIHFYRNDGTSTSPSWTFVTKYYNSIDVGYDSTPTFCDIDADGDYDMFIGGYDGGISFWRNMTIVNTPPIATITSISPSPAYEGDTVEFIGEVTDPDEGDTIVAYKWTSSIDGSLSKEATFTIDTLSLGTHTITFEAQDNHGAWSEPATEILEVKPKYELSLKNGETVSGNVYVTMTYRGNPLPWFYFNVDGQYTRYNPWMTQYFSNGKHTVYGQWYNWQEKKWYKTDPITVVVYNEISYTPEIISPTEGSEVLGNTTITFKAEGPCAYFATIYANEKIIGWKYLYGISSPYNFVWQTTTVPNGQYSLKVVIYYLYVGYTASKPVGVTVKNPAPLTIDISCPNPASGIIKVYIASNDDANFVLPILYVDGKFIGYKWYLPCNISWDTTRFKNGSHVIRVQAYHRLLRKWITADKTIQVRN